MNMLIVEYDLYWIFAGAVDIDCVTYMCCWLLWNASRNNNKKNNSLTETARSKRMHQANINHNSSHNKQRLQFIAVSFLGHFQKQFENANARVHTHTRTIHVLEMHNWCMFVQMQFDIHREHTYTFPHIPLESLVCNFSVQAIFRDGMRCDIDKSCSKPRDIKCSNSVERASERVRNESMGNRVNRRKAFHLHLFHLIPIRFMRWKKATLKWRDKARLNKATSRHTI